MVWWIAVFVFAGLLMFLVLWLFRGIGLFHGDPQNPDSARDRNRQQGIGAGAKRGGRRAQKGSADGGARSKCPVCGSALYAGENIVSRVYKGCDPTDQACSIMGCPQCYPLPKPGVKRVCPVCHKTIPPQGHLDAHLLELPGGKKHVHITGCTECCKRG